MVHFLFVVDGPRNHIHTFPLKLLYINSAYIDTHFKIKDTQLLIYSPLTLPRPTPPHRSTHSFVLAPSSTCHHSYTIHIKFV